MSSPYYKVNGVNMLPYIADGGLKWTENDLDSEDSGRTLDGTMYRGRVAIKEKHEISFRNLKTSEANIVISSLASGEFITVETNVHPKVGSVTMTMYNSSRTAGVFRVDPDGDAVWTDISVNLIER